MKIKCYLLLLYNLNARKETVGESERAGYFPQF